MVVSGCRSSGENIREKKGTKKTKKNYTMVKSSLRTADSSLRSASFSGDERGETSAVRRLGEILFFTQTTVLPRTDCIPQLNHRQISLLLTRLVHYTIPHMTTRANLYKCCCFVRDISYNESLRSH